MIRKDERGDVPVFAVFAIFAILITGTALVHFRTAGRQQAEAINMEKATDTVRASASAIEYDLNETLKSAILAAMYEVGRKDGTQEEVESKVRESLNDRIDHGWDFISVNENVPQVDENNLKFEWRQDGSLVVHGLQDASIKHVKGPTAYGLRLSSAPPRSPVPSPRFQRVKYVAERIADMAKTADDLDELEKETNDNYVAEGLYIKITPDYIEVIDTFGKKAILG